MTRFAHSAQAIKKKVNKPEKNVQIVKMPSCVQEYFLLQIGVTSPLPPSNFQNDKTVVYLA
jgi:hypothetical protein